MMATNENNTCEFPTIATTRRGAISSTISLESNEVVSIIEKDANTMRLLSLAVENNILFR
jgi:hypothetical protein